LEGTPLRLINIAVEEDIHSSTYAQYVERKHVAQAEDVLQTDVLQIKRKKQLHYEQNI